MNPSRDSRKRQCRPQRVRYEPYECTDGGERLRRRDILAQHVRTHQATAVVVKRTGTSMGLAVDDSRADITIKCEGEVFRVHKAVLIEHSDYIKNCLHFSCGKVSHLQRGQGTRLT